jgi:hypothetical protein
VTVDMGLTLLVILITQTIAAMPTDCRIVEHAAHRASSSYQSPRSYIDGEDGIRP